MLDTASPQRNATVCECRIAKRVGWDFSHTHTCQLIRRIKFAASASSIAVLTHLHGNEGLGSAAVSCTSGCVCAPAVMRAWEPPIPYTVFLNYPLQNVGGSGWGAGWAH